MYNPIKTLKESRKLEKRLIEVKNNEIERLAKDGKSDEEILSHLKTMPATTEFIENGMMLLPSETRPYFHVEAIKKLNTAFKKSIKNYRKNELSRSTKQTS